MNDSNRVLIAGGGPVGVITGLCLARAGIPVVVFDKEPKPPEDHRAATLQPSTLDLFEELGLTERLIELSFKSRYFQWRDRETHEVVAEFDYGLLSEVSKFPFVLQIEQHKTVGVAIGAARAYDTFVLHRPVEVIAIRQTADYVELEARDAQGDVSVHRGAFLVGCDGGRNTAKAKVGKHGPRPDNNSASARLGRGGKKKSRRRCQTTMN